MLNECYIGDCIDGMRKFAAAGISVQTCVTSPPYWGLRDYGHPGAYGLEDSPAEYVDRIVAVFRAVRDILADDGTIWVNMGDGYAGSGKGGNPDAGKQATNKGSQPIGVLYGKTGETARQAAVTNISRKSHEIGLKPKDLIGQPWLVAFALREDGWYLRQDIIWHKPNPMPESVTDRCTKAHEYLFLLSKSQRYYYDADAIREKSTSGRDDMREKGLRTGLGYLQQDPVASNAVKYKQPDGWNTTVGQGGHGSIHKRGRDKGRKSGNKSHKGKTAYDAGDEMRRTTAGLLDIADTAYEYRNKRSVWTVTSEPYPEAHFATFPRKLIEPCVLAGSRPGDIVLDPFMGSGTTAQVAEQLGRKWIGCEINPEYVALQADRLRQQHLSLDHD